MTNIINLKFENSSTRLAGFRFGEAIYNRQVKDIIDLDSTTTIIFPNSVERVASSFTQGFFADIKVKIGKSGIEKKIIILASNDDIAKSIFENIY